MSNFSEKLIDTTADENADVTKAIVHSMLYGSMKDILNAEGLDALKTAVDDNIAIFEAGVN